MKRLAKRVDNLEQAQGERKKIYLWVDYATDGGLVHDGIFYPDSTALISALGYGECKDILVYLFRWKESHTAAELLTMETKMVEAKERANQAPEPQIDSSISSAAFASPWAEPRLEYAIRPRHAFDSPTSSFRDFWEIKDCDYYEKKLQQQSLYGIKY